MEEGCCCGRDISLWGWISVASTAPFIESEAARRQKFRRGETSLSIPQKKNAFGSRIGKYLEAWPQRAHARAENRGDKIRGRVGNRETTCESALRRSSGVLCAY
jgi:hypothetical protein